MRIAFLSLFEAYPPTSGAAYVTYNCALLTPCTTLLVQLAGRATVERVNNLTIVSLEQRTSSRLKKMAHMPLTIAQMRREVSKFKPDCVVLEGASWAVYLLFLAIVLRKSLPGVKVVYHAHNVEYLLRQERNSHLVLAITRLAERYLLTTCDRSYAASPEDCQRLLSLYGVLPSLLPNGVDCSANRTTVDEIEAIREKYAITDESILFMGLYAYPPNTEAVRFLVEQVMPSLHRRRPDVRLIVTGGGPPSSPPWLINTGIISRRDLDAVLCACRVGVAPIFKGSGTRLKILEYMAAGLPVVTTRKGAEGLNLDADRHVLFAETAAEFQEALLRLFFDPSLSEGLSTRAASLVKSKFDWIPLLRQFANQLEDF
jgi:polysaccharide biosynthesis protein PslH